MTRCFGPFAAPASALAAALAIDSRAVERRQEVDIFEICFFRFSAALDDADG